MEQPSTSEADLTSDADVQDSFTSGSARVLAVLLPAEIAVEFGTNFRKF